MKPLRWLYNQPYLLLILTTLFWGGNAIAGKMAVGHVSPFMLTTSRWLVAVILVMPFAWKYLRRDWQIVRANLVFLLALGAIGFTAFNNLMYLALSSTTAINAAIIQSALPLFIFVMNFVLFQVPTTKYQRIGFPITVIGVVLITAQGSWDILSSLKFNVGDVLMLFAVVAYGIYSVLLNNKPKIHWLSTLATLSVAALVSSLPFALFEITSQAVIWPDLTGLAVVLYTAVCAALLSQAMWIRSIELVGSNTTSMFINLVPLFGALLAIVMLGERFYLYHAIGMVLIISGVTLSQRGR